ncbi:MAG: hypothetical protein KF858_03280 [Candidatus Sumerlaeia bacterium]|nr:hypothetical protein [Candidatus Sumerlaeia bacterium]
MRGSHFGLLALALTLTVAMVGCNRGPEKKRLEMDPRFSVNVMPVPSFWPRPNMDWPKEPLERVAHQRAWVEYGTPDFIRKVFTFDDRIVRPIELEERHTLIGKRPTPLMQWIYLDRGITVTFNGPRYEEGKLSDQLRVVCLHGDPNDIKEFPRPEFTQTSFYYHNHGLEFVFIDGVQTRRIRLSDPIHGATELR